MKNQKQIKTMLFPNLNPSTRRGIVFVATLVVGGAVMWFVLSHLGTEAEVETAITDAERQELRDFEAALRSDSAEWAARRGGRWQGGDDALHTGGELFAFDPNTADSATLVRLGLRPWQAHNCRQYVRKGGRWRSAEHFSRLYGLSQAEYARLRPYISIAADSAAIRWAAEREMREQEAEVRRLQAEERKRRSDSLRALAPEKLPAGTTVDLNTADTLLLRRIPEIGRWRAQKIVAYRERLGGFTRCEQLLEIEDIPASVVKWFYVAPGFEPRRMNVNTCSFKELVRHPYLSYEQVKEIMQYRRLHGKLTQWSDLSLSPLFTQGDFKRLSTYFTFEGTKK